jgi:uncharacterized protein YoxC
MVVGVLGIGVASWIAFVIIALVVLALAGYLITVAYVLNKVTFTLGTILIGVRSIAEQTEPVEEVVTGIAEDIAAIQASLGSLVPAPSRGARKALAKRASGTRAGTGRVSRRMSHR